MSRVLQLGFFQTVILLLVSQIIVLLLILYKIYKNMIDKIDPFNFPACRVSKSLPYGITNLEKCTPFKKEVVVKKLQSRARRF